MGRLTSETPMTARLRRNWAWLASLVIVLVTAGILVGSALQDDALAARSGDVVYSAYVMPKGYTSSVKLPFGTVGIELTKALTSVRDDDSMDGREPPDGGSFVGIEATLTKAAQSARFSDEAQPAAHFALLVGTHRYPVPTDPTTASTYSIGVSTRAWVAVDGVPSDVKVAVTFDGVQQIIDPRTGTRQTGRAAALYGDPPPIASPAGKSCGRVRLTAGFTVPADGRAPYCELGYLHRVPYVSGLGWPPAGKSWLQVSLRLEENLSVSWRDTRVYYRSVEGYDTVRLSIDGNAARVSELASYDGTTAFFPVSARPSGVLTVQVSTTFADLVAREYTASSGAPLDPDVRATWELTTR